METENKEKEQEKEPKKYFWLKLREHFFSQLAIKKLRKMPGGADYVIVYLKLQLASLKNDGCLYFVGIGDDLVDELAEELEEDRESVNFVLKFCLKLGWITISEAQDIVQFNNLDCGKETEAAVRMRALRESRKAQLTQLKKHNPALAVIAEKHLQ
ncbi:MAG: hypothetical protein E7198_10830 [Schwartzia succinivorans]|uniref:phage replisome organizer N-terminal domain-containing protein n=1 Tax=Schwartzia succinivorans TaxID=55507 RepID=UPI0023566848|nr:phage replisome organizer N-terminal domain-containing protein [Schwartzia succinivorans]MBE6098261.1 hypothetical protein [Schwartzia succinivorans]